MKCQSRSYHHDDHCYLFAWEIKPHHVCRRNLSSTSIGPLKTVYDAGARQPNGPLVWQWLQTPGTSNSSPRNGFRTMTTCEGTNRTSHTSLRSRLRERKRQGRNGPRRCVSSQARRFPRPGGSECANWRSDTGNFDRFAQHDYKHSHGILYYKCLRNETLRDKRAC